jgi:predicted amino acid-binding ACT domain protein
MTLGVVAAMGLALAACSRNITRVEQVVAGPQACFECHADTSTFLVAARQGRHHRRGHPGRAFGHHL